MFMIANQVLSLWHMEDTSRGSNKFSKYLIFATHWGLLFIVASLLLDACLVLARYNVENSKTYMDKREPHYEKCHGLLKFSTWLTATAYPAALFVTVMFWAFLFDFNKTFVFNTGSYLNLAVHLFQVKQFILCCPAISEYIFWPYSL
jgi:hypothetical protein